MFRLIHSIARSDNYLHIFYPLMLLTLKKLVMSLIYVFNVLMQANKQIKII